MHYPYISVDLKQFTMGELRVCKAGRWQSEQTEWDWILDHIWIQCESNLNIISHSATAFRLS